MSLLTKDYFIRNKGLALLGAGCGVLTVCLRYNPPPSDLSSELPASKPNLLLPPHKQKDTL